MLGEVLVAIGSIIGTIVGAYAGHRLTAYRVGKLEEAVNRVECTTIKVPILEERIKVINHRLDDLERGCSNCIGKN